MVEITFFKKIMHFDCVGKWWRNGFLCQNSWNENFETIPLVTKAHCPLSQYSAKAVLCDALVNGAFNVTGKSDSLCHGFLFSFGNIKLIKKSTQKG